VLRAVPVIFLTSRFRSVKTPNFSTTTPTNPEWRRSSPYLSSPEYGSPRPSDGSCCARHDNQNQVLVAKQFRIFFQSLFLRALELDKFYWFLPSVSVLALSWPM
jgi:hypothetical protein